MIDVIKLVASVLASTFKSRARLEVEILVLRHQLMILHRKAPLRPRLGIVDRLIFVWLYLLRPCVVDAVSIVRPETVVRWHQYSLHHKGVVYEAIIGERMRKCLVRVADLGLPRGRDAWHEFMRRIKEVKAATETAIAISDAPAGTASVLVVRLP